MTAGARVRVCFSCYAPIKSELHTFPPGKPRTFELLKIGLFKFLPHLAKMVFKCPIVSSDFFFQMPLLKNNRRWSLSSVIKLVYIRGTLRH